MTEQSISGWVMALIEARFFAKAVVAQPGLRVDPSRAFGPSTRGPSLDTSASTSVSFAIERSGPSANAAVSVARLLLDGATATVVHLAAITYATNTGSFTKFELFGPSLCFDDRFELAELCCTAPLGWKKTDSFEGVFERSARRSDGGAVYNTYVYDARTLTVFVHPATMTALVVHANYIDTST